MAKYNIGIIGAGNVGTHLCLAFSNAGHRVVVYTRRGATHLLKDVRNLVWTGELNSFKRGFDFIIIAVHDDGIHELAKKLEPEEGIVMHTSGNTKLDVFKGGKIKSYGVFYPLQSFHKKDKLKYAKIPVYIEANNKENLRKIRKLGRSFSNVVIDMNTEQRKRLHLAAVIVNNFSNHLFTLSEQYLKQYDISFKNLLPLLNTTTKRLDMNDPGDMQTGPAMRNDLKVIEEHLDKLKDEKELKEIYEIMTNSILQKYHKS